MIQTFAEWLQALPFAVLISESWFPQVESAHVFALTLFLGLLVTVDLRLAGFGSQQMRFTQLSDQLLPWTWLAFGCAAVTGSMLFMANATTYIDNTPFKAKMLLLVLAGLNMGYFQFVTFRGVAAWDAGRATGAARLAGITSLALWTAIVACGRWIGFV